MSKGLEALKQNKYLVIIPDNNMLKYNLNEEIAEKELKALEIINEKKVDLTRLYEAFRRNDLSFYNYYCYEPLTQEEYELLKEVLLW